MTKRAPPEPRPTVTIRDVARHAGVSIGTVSRAFKQQGGLTEATRAQVFRVAETLGYDTANLRAARLRRVSFLVHRQHSAPTANPFYSHVLHGVEDECRARGLTLLYSSVSQGEDAAAVVRRHEADGLLCVGHLGRALLADLGALKLPTVLIDSFAPGVASVNSDNFGGAYQAVRHLISLGRRRVAFIGGQAEHFSIQERRRGYRAALEDAGLAYQAALDATRDPPEQEEGARAAMRTLLALAAPPDAVFAFNDATALLAMRTCQAAGWRVPRDIAFVGFDDVGAAAGAYPPLSTVRVNKEALGARGVELLLDRKRGARESVTVPVELVVRESSGGTGKEQLRGS